MKNLLLFLTLLLLTNPLYAASLETEFKQLDKNNDNYISKDELLDVQKSSMEEQNSQILRALDTDKSGAVTREEFISFYDNFPPLKADNKDFNTKFDELDANKDNQLDVNEINKFRDDNFDNENEELFSVLDSNGDNQISYQEFELFYNNLSQVLN